MRTFFQDNRLYLAAFLVAAILGAYLLLTITQGDIIFYASENRSLFSDYLFIYGTRMGEEGAYLLFFALLLFYKNRYAIAVGTIGFITMFVSFGTKAFFMHDRPALYFRKLEMLDQINLIEGIDLHSGATSFPSGHTMSAFALFGLLAFMLPKPKKAWSLFFFGIAMIIGLSRIYLVQHFLKDIYLGAWMGLFIAFLVYYLFFRGLYQANPNATIKNKNHWLNKPIIPWRLWLRHWRKKRKAA